MKFHFNGATFVAGIFCGFAISQCQQSHAADSWSTSDLTRQGIYSALEVADWLQTRYIATHPQFQEYDAIFFGTHPSIGRVNTVFALGLVGGAAVTNFLPSRYRPYWQYAGISLEVYCIGNNATAGIRMQF